MANDLKFIKIRSVEVVVYATLHESAVVEETIPLHIAFGLGLILETVSEILVKGEDIL